MNTEQMREALHKIKHEAVSLADAQVIALEALTQRPAAPATPEPVGEVAGVFARDKYDVWHMLPPGSTRGTKLYTHPAPGVPMTDEQFTQLLRKLKRSREVFQAGRDSYETACAPMNSDDEAWFAYLAHHGIIKK